MYCIAYLFLHLPKYTLSQASLPSTNLATLERFKIPSEFKGIYSPFIGHLCIDLKVHYVIK